MACPMTLTRSSRAGDWINQLLVVAVLLIPSVFERRNIARAETVALWLFDEQQGLYPSCVLGDAATNNCPLVLGSGGQIVEGKYGNSLEPIAQPKIPLTLEGRYTGFKQRPKADSSRRTEPMDWANAYFCALMTRGEKHLRQEVGFASPTTTRLNLSDFDWTVEFWYLPTRSGSNDGVVFEIGEGPRGNNDRVTQLLLAAGQKSFTLYNQPSGTRLAIPTDARAGALAALGLCLRRCQPSASSLRGRQAATIARKMRIEAARSRRGRLS
jgi:hypothetical protein